jgi:hypothetical protein
VAVVAPPLEHSGYSAYSEQRRTALAEQIQAELARLRTTIERLEHSLTSINVAGMLGELDLRSTASDLRRLETLVVQVEKEIQHARSQSSVPPVESSAQRATPSR